MNFQQILFIILVALVALCLIILGILYISNPPNITEILSINDCTKEIVGNCSIK